jgi:serine/threonine protein kinase
LVTRDCRLADFGLSRILDLNSTHVSTQSIGTVPYMPPELLATGRMSKAVDVSSLRFGV